MLKAEAFVLAEWNKGNKSRTKYKGIETGYRKLISPERTSFLLMPAGGLHQACFPAKCPCCKDIDLQPHRTLPGSAPSALYAYVGTTC